MIFVSHSHFIRYILKKRNVILLLMFSSTYIPNMKAFPFIIPEKMRQIGFQTKKISVTHRFRCFASCQPHPFYGGKIVCLQQSQLIQLQFGGFFGGRYGPAAVGDGWSERHGQLNAGLAGVPQRFQLLIGLSRLYEKLPWWCSPDTDLGGLRILCQEHPLF